MNKRNTPRRIRLVIRNRVIIVDQGARVTPDRHSRQANKAVAREQPAVPQPQPQLTPVRPKPQVSHRAYIYGSEMDFIGKCILQSPNIETGGQLFGFWSGSGSPVVVYAIGPGPRANHQVAFFNQDVDYLKAVGDVLVTQFGLMHIGEWHSHHQLGLAQPSGHDAHTMQSSIDRLHLGRFLLCIGNCGNGRYSLNPFLFSEGDTDYVPVKWESKGDLSPYRNVIDAKLSALGLGTNHGSMRDSFQQDIINDSWFGDKGNRRLFKQIVDYISSQPDTIDVKPQVDGATVELVIRYADRMESIKFPADYPDSPLTVKRLFSNGSRQNLTIPPPKGRICMDVYTTFINQYNSNTL